MVDILAPTDPIEALIMALPSDVLTRVHRALDEPSNQSLAMAVTGLLSFSLMGFDFFMPNAYAHVSALHIVLRVALCIGLCVYLYRELFVKRWRSASAEGKDDNGKPRRRALSFAPPQSPIAVTPASAADATEATAKSAAESESATAATAATSPAGSKSRAPFYAPLPEYVTRVAELCGAESAFTELPVPTNLRSGNLIFDALSGRGLVEGAWAFVHKSFFAGAKSIGAILPDRIARRDTSAATATDAASSASTTGAGDAKAAEAGSAAAAAPSFPEVVGVYSLGDRVCGHPKLIHGGLTAALLDQTLGIAAFAGAPKTSFFTANLNVNYRKPLPAHTAVAVRCRATRIEGRKLFATGRVELLNDANTLFADATALFIAPK